MKNRPTMFRRIALSCLVSLCFSLRATTYWVAPTGSDSNSGTASNAPFASPVDGAPVIASENGVARLNFFGQTGVTYTVEFATAMTNWVWLNSLVCTGSPTRLVDMAANNSARFYRARY
jgi:hypothetical protein